MTSRAQIPQDASEATKRALPVQDDMAKHTPSIDEKTFEEFPFNQEGPLCWPCFLPIFGNRPDMFDGGLGLASQEEAPICQNIEDRCKRNSDVGSSQGHNGMHASSCLDSITANTDKEGLSPVIVTSPVATHPNGHFIKQEHTGDPSPLTGNCDIKEASDEMLSVTDQDGINSAQYLDGLESSTRYCSSIYDSNIIGGMEVRVVVQQGDMEIPFAASIPFPFARNAWYKGFEASPLCAGADVTVHGSIKVGSQDLFFRALMHSS